VGSKSIRVGLYSVARSQLVNTYERFRIANNGETLRRLLACVAGKGVLPLPPSPIPEPYASAFCRQGCATVPINFVIADGIIGMEGVWKATALSTVLRGTWAKIVVSGDPVAADATCARLMGFEPNRPHS